MLKFEQIPDVVIEQALAMRDRGGSMRDIIRTAINAWPGMFHHPARPDGEECIFLPVEQEASDE